MNLQDGGKRKDSLLYANMPRDGALPVTAPGQAGWGRERWRALAEGAPVSPDRYLVSILVGQFVYFGGGTKIKE